MKKLLLTFAICCIPTFVNAQSVQECCSSHQGVFGVCNGIVACNDGRMETSCSEIPEDFIPSYGVVTTTETELDEIYGKLKTENPLMPVIEFNTLYRNATVGHSVQLSKLQQLIQSNLKYSYNQCLDNYIKLLDEDSTCKQQFGGYATRVKLEDEQLTCGCNVGYTRNDSNTLCIKQMGTENSCKSRYGEHAKVDENNPKYCACESGYKFVEGNGTTQCVVDGYTSDKTEELKKIVNAVLSNNVSKDQISSIFTKCSETHKDPDMRLICGNLSDWLLAL